MPKSTPPAASATSSDRDIAAIRRFNRFYTRKLGVLRQHLMESPFSLAQARLLHELAHCDKPTATDLAAELSLDAGYLSRLLRGLASERLISRKPTPEDRRQQHLALTAKGRAAYARLDRDSRAAAASWLAPLAGRDRKRLIAAFETAERLLANDAPVAPPMLRAPRPGDMGWVVLSHAALYAREFGFDSSFEALVARIVADFITTLDPARERCWIAELDGANVGSVFLVRHSDETAKLRLLLVDEAGRGHGLGTRLVGECIAFARQCGYRAISLWTQSNLLAARRIYQNAGFALTASEPHRSFGQNLVGETWELRL